MKKTGLFLILVGFILVFLTGIALAEVKWLSLKEGTEKAKIEKKPMIVDFFYGKGCPRCEFLEKNVYADPVISKKIMDDFVPIRVDLTRKLTKEEEQLGNRYEFKKDCLLLFLDPDTNVLSAKGKRLCFIDKVDPDEFVEYLDSIKSGPKSSK